MTRICSKCCVELPDGAGAQYKGQDLCTWHYCEAIGEDPRDHYQTAGCQHEGPTIESEVRDRHELEDRLAHFLALASAMTDRELEIALARLADRVQRRAKSNEENIRAKGMVLKCYYSLRVSHAKRQSMLQRARAAIGLGPVGERLIQKVTDYILVLSKGELGDDDSDDLPERIKLLAP